jgi:hypothetical protein
MGKRFSVLTFVFAANEVHCVSLFWNSSPRKYHANISIQLNETNKQTNKPFTLFE